MRSRVFPSGFIRLNGDGQMARLVLDRPLRGHAWLIEMWDEAAAAVRLVEGDNSVRVLLLESTGTSVFSGGADLDQLAELATVEAVEGLLHRAEAFLSSLERSSKVVIAVINGAAVGAGLQIAAACDFRVASRTARFGVPAARLGLVIPRPDVTRLVRVAGPTFARELLLTSRIVDADEALARGLVSAVHDSADLPAHAEAWARGICELSPHSLSAMKRHLLAVSGPAPASRAAFADSIAALLSDELRAALSARTP